MVRKPGDIWLDRFFIDFFWVFFKLTKTKRSVKGIEFPQRKSKDRRNPNS